MINRIFRTSKPIVAMVHLQYRRNLNQLLEEALRDIERLERGGVDGLLFENWGGDYTDRFVTQEVREYVTAVMREASKRTKLPKNKTTLWNKYITSGLWNWFWYCKAN